MKAIMVMFDSLNRRMLPPYGCDWVHAPNFVRLAERTAAFENCYAGSMPTMPARRELHTGRYNFLHRGWTPLEPFDDSTPETLARSGVYTHLASDGYHYWEDGGATYHNRYSSWEISRGQEGDRWKGDLTIKDYEVQLNKTKDSWLRQDSVNRKYMQDEKDQPQAKTFAMGLEFMRTNRDEDNWFLQIETFDPHEPYFSSRKYKDLYPHDYDGPLFDWPPYGPVTETPEQVRHMRYENAALVSMCDAHLGKVLDLMDEQDMWDDTMLIVNTDHGFLLGERNLWGKCIGPYYNELAQLPLFIWDPRAGVRGERRRALVQTIDLPATLLEYFGVDLPADMQGLALRETIASDTPVRRAGLFGQHGGHVNCTDGRYVYMRGTAKPENEPLFNYTLMPMHMRGMFSIEELKTTQLAEPFSFTKGLRTMKIGRPAARNPDVYQFSTLLFDLENDPGQEHPITDPRIEEMMIAHTLRLMKENDAPAEQFERLGLPTDV